MAKFNFDNLKVAATAEFALYQLEGAPVLTLAPATEDNAPFFNEAVRRANKKAAVVKAAGVTPDLIRTTREEDRDVYARHVLKGWRGIKDADGEDVPFTVENALEFLQALPGWIFEDIRTFAGNPSNFLPEGAADPETVAGN